MRDEVHRQQIAQNEAAWFKPGNYASYQLDQDIKDYANREWERIAKAKNLNEVDARKEAETEYVFSL